MIVLRTKYIAKNVCDRVSVQLGRGNKIIQKCLHLLMKFEIYFCSAQIRLFKVYTQRHVAWKKALSEHVMGKGDLTLLYCKQWPHIGCTSITELQFWGQDLSTSMIPHARQIFGTKGVHAVLKVFETWIWVRKRGGTGNEECLRSLSHFLCQHCPIQETNRKFTLTFDGRSMKFTLYSSWTFTSKHLANKTLKATQA